MTRAPGRLSIITASAIASAVLAGIAVGVERAAWAADVVPLVIQQPGTQPQEISNLESPDKCDNCHGGYNSAVEPAHNWRGSMMAHAGRDPIFWATLAIAEQDFLPGEGGAGDLCIRCHSTAGWLAGRSTPTDGSGLAAGDADGVECDFCHKMTNPDDSGHLGVMLSGFVANEDNPLDEFDWDVDWPELEQGPNGIEGYYGSGIASMWGGSDKLGPYDNAEARHQFMHSKFHRDRDFCGTCHDVSNPAVGNLAPNHGAQATADPVTADGLPDGDLAGKAAFNNPPYKYGIVERTFSEYKAGQISQTLVQDYKTLPSDLQGGALAAAYNAATKNGTIDPNYSNPAMPRYFSCQTCHMRPVTGKGANKNGVPVRNDLPLHDMTGGNYWMPLAIEYLNSKGKLRLGGGMSANQLNAMLDGALRAKEQLELAATLSVSGDTSPTVKIINHTGHKLISGYPEGRRMWLNIKWKDGAGALVREDGAYGPLFHADGVTPVTAEDPATGQQVHVKSLLDLNGTNTRIYETHMGMTQDWAVQLVALGYPEVLALSYDRVTGEADLTLGDLADTDYPGTSHETFHFVLNNTVVEDNRIPPYGMSYEVARVRNALPVPANQYGDPDANGVYNYWDTVTLSKPAGAVSAEIKLMYQPTSWEYIQFLSLANNGENAFLADEGRNMLEAWLNTDMAEPYVMASANWGASPEPCLATAPEGLTVTAGSNAEIQISWETVANVAGYRLYYDQAGKADLIIDCPTCTAYTDTGLTNGQQYCYKVTSHTDACESDFSTTLCATASQPGQITTVPELIGETQGAATQLILDAGLLLADPVGAAYSDTIAVDLVLSQSPAAGTQVQQDSQVNIVISLGPAPAVVCSTLESKPACSAEPSCAWEGKGKNGICVDIAP